MSYTKNTKPPQIPPDSSLSHCGLRTSAPVACDCTSAFSGSFSSASILSSNKLGLLCLPTRFCFLMGWLVSYHAQNSTFEPSLTFLLTPGNITLSSPTNQSNCMLLIQGPQQISHPMEFPPPGTAIAQSSPAVYFDRVTD